MGGSMLNQIIKYLEETVQDHIELHKWKKSTNLIFRFQDRFKYYEVNLLRYPIVLIEEKDSNATLKEMTTLIKMIKKQGVDYCAMIFTDITSYKRKK